MTDGLLHDSVLFVFSSRHGVCFSGTRLAIGKDRAPFALERCTINKMFDLGKRVFLLGIFVKNRRKLEVLSVFTRANNDDSIVSDLIAFLSMHRVKALTVAHLSDTQPHRDVRGLLVQVSFLECPFLIFCHRIVESVKPVSDFPYVRL